MDIPPLLSIVLKTIAFIWIVFLFHEAVEFSNLSLETRQVAVNGVSNNQSKNAYSNGFSDLRGKSNSSESFFFLKVKSSLTLSNLYTFIFLTISILKSKQHYYFILNFQVCHTRNCPLLDFLSNLCYLFQEIMNSSL